MEPLFNELVQFRMGATTALLSAIDAPSTRDQTYLLLARGMRGFLPRMALSAALGEK